MTPARSARDWTAVWLGCAAAVLLSLAAAVLSQVHDRQMQALHAQAAQTRAQLMAQSMGQRLASATAAGIPLHQLVGVPNFLDRWHQSHPEVTKITVHDLDGLLLWRSHPRDGPSIGEVSIGRADVAAAGVAQARVSVALRNGSEQGTGRRLGLLAPAVLLISALAYLGALFACAQGPWQRNHGLRMIARWAIRGDYRHLLVLPQRQRFDLRVQEVVHAMRDIHERMARMRLLIGSLRRTEPQQLRRDYLDQVLQQTEGQDRFAQDQQQVVRLVAVQFRSMWMALLLSLGAIAPLTYALRVFEHGKGHPGAWQQALPAACLGALVLFAAVGWKLSARLRMTPLGVLALGQAALLLAPLALLLDSSLHPGWIAAWNGCFAGAALAACTHAQTRPDTLPGFVHVQPGIAAAALRAWWGGLLWLAPALGFYAQVALRPPWALLALLLPIVCGLLFVTRWDVPHSPWRIRMAAAAAPLRAARDWRWLALGAAAGLVAGTVLAALSTSRTDSPSALLQQCALGLGLAMVWGWRGSSSRAKPSPRRWRAIALFALALQLAGAVAANAGWPAQDLAWLPAWLLGLLLAHKLSQAAHASQDATSRQLLLGGALGAALSAGALALGLHDGPAVLALLLLAPWTAARNKGADVS